MTRRRIVLPRSRVPRIRLSPADLRELAASAGRRGRTAAPMSSARRALNYDRLNGGPVQLKPAQYRRWTHKYNKINDPAGKRGGEPR